LRQCAAQPGPARCLLPLPTIRALLPLLVALLAAGQHPAGPLLRLVLLALLLVLRPRQTERGH
jgi:hypothetical protein